tara:strand:- start:4787 stop:5761 length:975 start_codon:yes stop_codon:yes gene_type:complete
MLWHMSKFDFIFLPLLGLIAGAAFAAQPETRTFEIKVSFEGAQDWSNPPQWYKASSKQKFLVRTELYSNGKRYAANLLDVDMQKRMKIKAEFQRQRGLATLRAEGIDTSSSNLQQRISERMDQEITACQQDMSCVAQVSMKYAESMSAAMAPDNSALFEGEPRYAYYQPFEGCQSFVKGSIIISAKGETNRSKLRKKKKVYPFALEMKGMESTSVEQKERPLCSYFLIVLDESAQNMYVENVFFPDVRGSAHRLEFGEQSHNENASVPMAAPIQPWVNSQLRDAAALQGSMSKNLSLPLPLDGNATILGNFDGEGKATMTWSFR